MDYKQMQDLMKMQQEANRIKTELSNTHIEAEFEGVLVTVDGEMKIVSVIIQDETLLKNKAKLENTIREATNKGLKKAQEIAAEKMQGLMGQMGLNLPSA